MRTTLGRHPVAESTTTSRPALSLELLLVVGGILTGIDRFLPAILMVTAAFGLLGAMQDPSGLRDRSAPGLYIHASAAFSVVLMASVAGIAAGDFVTKLVSS